MRSAGAGMNSKLQVPFTGREEHLRALSAGVLDRRVACSLGPPGIGKSALLRRFAETVAEWGRIPGNAHFTCCEAPPECFALPPSDFAALKRKWRSQGPPQGNLVIVVDNAERLPADSEQARLNLASLNAPVAYFGLPGARDALESLSGRPLPRASHLPLGPLSPGQGRLALRSGCLNYDAYASLAPNDAPGRAVLEATIDALAKGSQEHPQYLSLAAETLSRRSGDPVPMDEAWRERVLREHKAAMGAYYFKAMLPDEPFTSHKTGLGGMARWLLSGKGRLPREDALVLLMAGDESGWAVSRGRAEEVLKAALDLGVFDRAENGSVDWPLHRETMTRLDAWFQRVLDLGHVSACSMVRHMETPGGSPRPPMRRGTLQP